MSVPHAPARARRRLSAYLVGTVVAALAVAGLGPVPQASAAAPTLSYVASASAAPTSTSHTVKIPAGVQAGDTLLLFMTANSKSGTLTGPTGWTQLQTKDGTASRGRVWTKKATGTDAGTSVTAKTSVTVKSTLNVVAYRSSAGTSAVTASAIATVGGSATSHKTPTTTAGQAGSWLVSYWSGKTSATTAPTWTPPTNVTKRTGANATGANLVTGILADSNKAIPTGAVAARLARTSKAITSSQLMSVVVSPGLAPANQAPVPAYTSSCTSLACTFDATGSTDADHDPLTYAWNFGDGSTSPASSTATATHTYAKTGGHTVTLTVSDGKTTAQTLAKTVTATYAEPLPGHTGLVPETARKGLPKFTKADGSPGEIDDIEVIGNTVWVAGDFTTVSNTDANNNPTTSYNQPYVASYDLGTGLVNASFRPTFAGPAGLGVAAVEASPDGSRLYVAGAFNTVNGVARKGVAELDPDTGATVQAFTANTDQRATALATTATTVYIGGRFTTINGQAHRSLGAVDALTGTVDSGFVMDLSGGIGVDGGLTVQQLLITHDGSKMVVLHTGRQINGQDRYGVAIIDLANKALLPWSTNLWKDNLQYVGGIQRIISGSIAPDDSWFVASSGSGGDRPPINDTVVAFPMSGGGDVQPRWVSRCFDSVYSTAISEKAVYIGGHFSWNESPQAPDPWPGLATVGYGTGQGLSGYGLGDAVVARDHLGALDPATGHALEWNPGSDSNNGNTAMALTPRGLLAGGDAVSQGGSKVGQVAFFDFKDPGATPDNGVTQTIDSPIAGRVSPTGTDLTISGTATAPNGVRKVFVEIQNRDNTSLWLQADKHTFGTGDVSIPATVTPTSATTATWSLTINVATNVRMLAKARAQDTAAGGGAGTNAANKTLKKFETFSLDDTPPTVAYTAPAAGVVNSKTFTISGTANDDKGVTGITLTLRNSAGDYLQDDGSVDGAYNAINIAPDVPEATQTTWSKEITVPTEETWNAQILGHDTGGNSSLDTVDRSFNVTEHGMAPAVSISTPGSVVPPTAPQPVTVTPGHPITFSGAATDDGSIKSVYIAMLNNSTGEDLTTDGSWGIDNGLNLYKLPGTPDPTKQTYNWSWTTPQNVTPGNYTFAVMAVDNDGISTPQSAWALMTMNAVYPGDAPPDANLTTQGVQPSGNSLSVPISGTATDDNGVNGVRLVVKDLDTSQYLHPDGTATTTYDSVPATLDNAGATSVSFTTTLVLPHAGNWNVTAFAVDTQGQRDLTTTGNTARYPLYPGDNPPTLTDNLLTPTEGNVFTDGKIQVSGRAEDDQNTDKAEIAIINSSGQYLQASGSFSGTESWRAAFLTSPGSAGSNFAYTSPVVPAGDYTIKVRAYDQHGQVTATPSVRHVTVQIPAGNTKPVAVLPAPVCGAGTDPSNVCTFNGKNSTDDDPATLTYSWNFGTGQGTGTGPNPKKTFTAAGDFVVTLIAKDKWGVASDPVMTTVHIVEPAGNTAPAAVIQPPSCNNLTCNFSAVGTTDNVGDVITYAWNFGDSANNTAAGAATSHVFSGPGTYTVTLVATDGWGESSTKTMDVTVPSP